MFGYETGGGGRGHHGHSCLGYAQLYNEYVLPGLARRAQQQIRLHEVARTQRRRLALVF